MRIIAEVDSEEDIDRSTSNNFN